MIGATESVLQIQVFAWAAAMEHRWPELALLHAIPNSGGFTGNYRQNMLRVLAMKKQGVKPGVPDIHLPVARGGFTGFYGEMKRIILHPTKTKGVRQERTRTTPEQDAWAERLREQGHYVCTAWIAEEMQAELERYLNLPPTQITRP